MPPINIMIKPASGLCNMRCAYCFYADEMKNRMTDSYGIMTENTLEKVIKKTLAFAQGQCTIMYQGGEPTLAGLDFFQRSMELQEKYNVNHVRIQNALQTNGYAIDEKWCEFFAANQFLVGLSMDGIKATHDVYRKDAKGQDTYFKVLEAAKLLEKYRVDYNILTVVNGKTAPKIRKIYEQYRKAGYRYQQYIPCLEPLGGDGALSEYALKPEVYGKFLMELFELWEIDLKQGKEPYIRQFDNWIGILMGIVPEACDQRGICGIQNVIEADGSVYPCDFYVLDDYCLGNLKEQSMEEIYRNRERIHFLEKGQQHSEECKQCKYYSVCRAGCRRYRQEAEGDYKNILCQAYKMFFDKYYESLVEIAGILRNATLQKKM